MFTITINSETHVIDWPELNQLKKDILWIFDANTGQLNASFVPDYSFKSKYWKYLTLADKESSVETEDIDFFKEGILIIILCMTVEYLDTASGNQHVFGDTTIKDIIYQVQAFKPSNQNQEKLQKLLLSGLTVADSMTPADMANTEEYDHKDLPTFYSQLNWVDETFIKAYFNSKAK